MAAGDLHAAAAELLAAAQVAVATTTGGAIPRAFVAQGAPAFDCAPQLTVHVQQFGYDAVAPQAAPLDPRSSAPGHISALLLVTVLRCHPIVESAGPKIVLPSVAALSAASAESAQDGWAVFNLVASRHRAGTLFSGKCRSLAVLTATTITPQGGHGGYAIPVMVQVGGYTL